MNFGDAKGGAFERVLVYPTEPMTKWLLNHAVELKQQSRARLYVAVTRAIKSVGFVVDDKTARRLDIGASDLRHWLG